MTTQLKKTLVFVALFGILALIALNLPLVQLTGSKVKFTAFDAFSPIAGAFLGSIPGIVAVFLAEIVNFLIHGAKILDAGTIIRFFPILFATFYFAKPRKINFLIPLLAIIAFNLHPIGRSAWQFSLFWLIPIVMEFFREKNLLARALGATFTAHSVGGALWVWTFGLSKTIWLSLIPVVAIERGIFALGICATYLAMNNILAVLDNRKIVNAKNLINENFVWGKLIRSPLS